MPYGGVESASVPCLIDPFVLDDVLSVHSPFEHTQLQRLSFTLFSGWRSCGDLAQWWGGFWVWGWNPGLHSDHVADHIWWSSSGILITFPGWLGFFSLCSLRLSPRSSSIFKNEHNRVSRCFPTRHAPRHSCSAFITHFHLKYTVQ